jgi:hypothetical protein
VSPARTPGCRPTTRCSARVTKGQDVVDKIGVAEVGPDEKPLQPIVIREIRITES